jgi:hypothetical protein
MIDVDKHMSTKIELTSPKGNTYTMSEYEVCRWMSLVEAVDIINEKSEQLGVKASSVNWVKPIAIQKYIDERTEGILYEVKDDLAAEKRCTTS